MSYHYQTYRRFFAQAAGHIEGLASEELKELGATKVEPAYRGVYFEGDTACLYRVNYASRLVTRVLAPIIEFDCHSDRYLYKTAKQIDWSDFLGLNTTFAVFATVSNSWISHSQFAARRLKDAIVDQFREKTGKRPSVRTPDPDLWLNLHIHANRATISIDTSGGSLHRRGYRVASVDAPMQETVAATVIRMTEWQGDRPLYDPMCGSGTLLAEAYMVAAGVPAGFRRKHFGFRRLPDFDAAVWSAVRAEWSDDPPSIPGGLVRGSDLDADAVSAARSNLASIPGGDQVGVTRHDFRSLDGLKDAVIVVNPPYGVRIGQRVEDLFKALGDWLKQECAGSTAFIYAGKPQLLKSVGLRTTWKKPLVNGAMEGRLARYDLY